MAPLTRILAAALALLGATLSPAAAAAAPADGTVEPAAPTYREIRLIHTNDCIEIEGSSTLTGADIQTYDCVNQAGSKWELRRPPGHTGPYYWIYNPGSNKCISIRGYESGHPANGAYLQLEPCEWAGADNGAGDDSAWRFPSDGTGGLRMIPRTTDTTAPVMCAADTSTLVAVRYCPSSSSPDLHLFRWKHVAWT